MTLGDFNRLSYFPSAHASHASIQHAVRYKLCSESLLSVPKSAVVDGIIGYGGSTGVGLNLPRKAYGEFYERNHLFSRVPINSRKELGKVTPKTFREKLLSLCKINNKLEQCLEHQFSFTTVHHLFENTPQDYFYNAISLNGVRNDRTYLNFSDSCACAVHPLKEKALYNALMEFIERQALLGSWLSQTYQYTINPEVLRKATPYVELVDMLLENGELYIFQNGNQLPAYTVIMYYFSHSQQDIVQYSTGSSSGFTLQEALISSLEELYQCYTFLYNQESSSGLEDKAGSGYHMDFQQCNHQGIREIIPFLKEINPFKIDTVEDLHSLRTFTYQDALNDLVKISSDIYYYHQFEEGLNLHCIKILSPDFFAHMSLNNNLNFENSYAKLLNITRENAYLAKIPFP